MNSRLWRLLMLVIARPELLLADTGVIAEAGQGLSQGFMILLAVAALIAVVVCSSILSWFFRGIKNEPVHTTEFIPKPFENQQQQELFQWLCEEVASQTDTDIENDSLAMQRLREAFAKAIKELESAETAEINLPFIAVKSSGPCHFIKTLSRADLRSFQT